MQNNLSYLAQVFEHITDPRSKHGTYQPCSGILALTFLGLLAGQNYFTHIYRWAKQVRRQTTDGRHQQKNRNTR